ncbi:hypothetical protein EVAR_40649_1 [Eumeta japonica]|uniref:Uncharacterized protein n=1 Tax=Eumeta variegata TaxID=151549 RepID=A0A4C1X791_EUMVA|nr:hypothetical protein EVAR_40649_1 [Eumeta japonica]
MARKKVASRRGECAKRRERGSRVAGRGARGAGRLRPWDSARRASRPPPPAAPPRPAFQRASLRIYSGEAAALSARSTALSGHGAARGCALHFYDLYAFQVKNTDEFRCSHTSLAGGARAGGRVGSYLRAAARAARSNSP